MEIKAPIKTIMKKSKMYLLIIERGQQFVYDK